jgi:hypothetical protein
VSRLFIAAGLVLLGIGVMLQLGVPLGRLPGDIVVRRGNSTLYVPIVTCLLLSVVLSIVAVLMRR